MNTEIRVTAAQVTSVAIPMRGRLHHSDGTNSPWQARHVVELHTDAGVTGLGEASPRVNPADLAAAADCLVGQDPFQHERVRRLVQSDKFYRMEQANIAAALQTACLDIQGKVVGRPVADLLGGRMRESVPVIAYLFRKTGEHGCPDVHDEADVVAEAQRLVDRHGFRTLKYKAGAVGPAADLAAAQALRRRFPSHLLRVDPNGAWSVATALRVGRQCVELDLEWLEDPTLGLEGMAEFARRVPVPTATNMCCIQPREFAATVRARAVNVMLLDPWYLGGPWSARQMAAACHTFDVGVGIHAGGGSAETGIGLAAEAHLAAAIPGLVNAIDTMTYELTDDIVTGDGWDCVDGSLAVPEKPGLGVELDRDRLDRYAAEYRRHARPSSRDPHPAYPRY